MSIGRKLALAAALSAPPVLVLAPPAVADTEKSAHAQKDVTFEWNGEVTCTFEGNLRSHHYDAGDITEIAAGSGASGDPACGDDEVVTSTELLVTYRVAGEDRDETSRAVGRGGNAGLTVTVNGSLTKLSLRVVWSYHCAGDESDPCGTFVQTSTK